ncbi:MAG: methyltransferase domain-containing protein [Candidatus Hermodarchaeota archaeon]
MLITEKKIQESYTKALSKTKMSKSACCTSSTCCPPSSEVSIENIQSSSDQKSQPISFGCILLEGFLNETLKLGDTVIDFGSGPGHDLMIAARIVGSTGRAIGVDFTDAMIAEAQSMAEKEGFTHVELVKANIEDIPLPDNIADVIISNCVINLALNKANVFKEAFRLLKPGGVLIDADVIAESPLPDEIVNDKELWCSCIGGALTASKYRQLLEAEGFTNISIEIGSKSEVIFDKQEIGILSGVIKAQKPL